MRIDIEPPQDALGLKPDDFPMPLCGAAVARGLREPELGYWPNHTAWSAAGSVAEGLFAVQEGIWSWSKWEAHCRSNYEEEIAELVKWPDEASNFGDIGGWFRLGCEYDLPVAFDDYWRGWEEAERIVRDDWNIVKALALAAIATKRLSESEVLSICETDIE